MCLNLPISTMSIDIYEQRQLTTCWFDSLLRPWLVFIRIVNCVIGFEDNIFWLWSYFDLGCFSTWAITYRWCILWENTFNTNCVCWYAFKWTHWQSQQIAWDLYSKWRLVPCWRVFIFIMDLYFWYGKREDHQYILRIRHGRYVSTD